VIALRQVSIIAVFGFLYGWDVWEALGNLVGLEPFYAAFGIPEAVPWVLLWVGVTLPVVAFGISLWLWRSLDSLIERFSVLLLGWATVGALSLSISAIEQAWRASALQALIG
jgi:hypothetical protein